MEDEGEGEGKKRKKEKGERRREGLPPTLAIARVGGCGKNEVEDTHTTGITSLGTGR